MIMQTKKIELTADALICEYMIYKVQNGYEPGFTTDEFITFLKYFNTQIPVDIPTYDGEELFKGFFKRKEPDWETYLDGTYIFLPHMDMEFSRKIDDYYISANYRLDYDDCIRANYRPDYDIIPESEIANIRTIIGEYLSKFPKRKVKFSKNVDQKALEIGKTIAAEFVLDIWKSYVEEMIADEKWPQQCKDIESYLFKADLASIIGVKSIKEDLLKFYITLSRRVSYLYQQNPKTQVSTSERFYLAYANYKFLVRGYESLVEDVYGPNGVSLNIVLSTDFKKSHKKYYPPMWDEDPEIVTTATPVGSNQQKRLALLLDSEAHKPKSE